jgi:hypothetical protein
MEHVLKHQLRLFDKQIEEQENFLNLENLGMKPKESNFKMKDIPFNVDHTKDIKKVLVEANLPTEGPLRERIIEKYDLKSSI